MYPRSQVSVLGAAVADVVLAGILGAAALAVFLLHWAHQRSRETITQLRAKVAAQRIAAMPLGRKSVVAASDAPEEPVRRSGGAAALLAPFGDRAASVWRGHRTATITVAAATVAIVGALALTSGGSTPRTATAAPPATASGAIPDARQDKKGDGEGTEHSPAEEGDDTGVTHDDSNARAFSGPGSVAPLAAEPTPGTSSTPASGGEDRTEPPTGGTPAPDRTTAPGPPGTTAPGPGASPATTPPAPTPKPSAPQKPDTCDGVIDLHLPLLPDVCLL